MRNMRLIRSKVSFIISLITIGLIFQISLIARIQNVRAVTDPEEVNVAIIAEQGNIDFETALSLDERTQYTLFTSQNYSLYLLQIFTCTFLLDFVNIPLEIATEIATRVNNGMGLFFQSNNPAQSYNITAFSPIDALLPVKIQTNPAGSPIEFAHTDFENINTRQQETDHFLTQRIDFLSLPQLINLTQSTLATNAQSIVVSDQDWPIITGGSFGAGQIVALTTPVRTDSNEHLADWPLFTYMVFACAMSLSGVEEYETYGEWQGSPIPKANVRIVIIIILISIVTVTFMLFSAMRRLSRRKPLELLPVTVKPDEKLSTDLEIASTSATPPQTESKKIATKPEKKHEEPIQGRSWETIGFHKPLAGFSIMFFISLGLLLPLIIVVMYILPTFILQDPAQFGIMFIAGNIFSAIFIAGDFGLAQAFDKFVGEYYIKDPREALKYIQFFVWFQMFSGLIQTVGIALIGLFLIPNSMQIAFMSWTFVLKAFIQWPGIAYLFTHTLKALQRTDREQLVNLICLIIFDLAGIAIFSGLFLNLGKSDPRIGSVIGGSMGVTVSEVVKVFGLLLIGGIMLHKTDKRFRIGDIFRVDFDWPLAKKTLLFGLKAMLSSVIFLLGNFVVTLIIMLQLPNYTYWGSFLGSATMLLYPVTFMIILYENMLPTNAEAYGAGCVRLTETYVSYGFKYAGLFGILIFVIFAFFVNNFLTTILPPLFKPMGFFIGFYAITKIFTNIGDYSRLFLVSINRVGLYVLFVTIEQIIRIILIVTLIDKIAHPEYLLIWGELPGVIMKVLLTWVYTHKKVIKVHINWWQSVIAPSIASFIFVLVGLALNPVYLALITALGGNALVPTIVYAFVVCLGLAIFFYPFLVGFLGGWDDRSLADMEFAAQYAGPSKFFAKMFLRMTKLGCKKSPLHNKFPIMVEGTEPELSILYKLKQDAVSNK